MVYNNDSVRNKLIEITDKGLILKAIAVSVGIDVNDLSRFKGGVDENGSNKHYIGLIIFDNVGLAHDASIGNLCIS